MNFKLIMSGNAKKMTPDIESLILDQSEDGSSARSEKLNFSPWILTTNWE